MSPHKRTDEGAILAVWQAQMKHATKNPFLFQLLLQQLRRALKRLAYFYAQLASLPRRNRRALQRALATSLVGAAMLLALSSAPIVHAATITVDDSTDTLHFAGCAADGTTSPCSLRDALTFAYTNAGPHTIDLQFAAAGTTIAAGPLPEVKTTVTIQGNGKYISGDNAYRVLEVITPSGDLTIDGATIQDGSASYAAGVFNNLATLTVKNSTITGNRAVFGAGIGNYHAKTYVADSLISDNYALDNGGGVLSYGGDAELKIVRSTLSGNSAFRGGGVDAYLEPMTGGTHLTQIYSSTITGSLEGGGVSSAYAYYPGGLRLVNDTITENYSYAYGAGVNCEYNYSVGISQTSITNNTSRYDAGGFDSDRCVAGISASTISGNYSYSSGAGGIDNDGSFLFMVNSTVSGNNSYERYGGIGNFDATLYLINSTVADNHTVNGDGGGIKAYSYSTVTLERSIITGNSAGGNGNEVYADNATGPRPPSAPTHAQILARRQKEEQAHKARIEKRKSQHHGSAEQSQGSWKHRFHASNPAAAKAWRAKHPSNRPSAPTLGTVINADDYNLFGNNSEDTATALYNFTPGPTDLVLTNDSGNVPLGSIMNPLGANGGFVTGDPNTGTTTIQTHELVLGSPAIDQAPNLECSNKAVGDVDERSFGFARNILITGANGPNNLCDIGAFELQSTTGVNLTGIHGNLNKNGNVVLHWRTVTESQIAGFNVYRQGKQGEWKQINKALRQAKHAGDALGEKYRFTDRKAQSGKTHRYKIQVVYLDGHTEWTTVVRVKKP